MSSKSSILFVIFFQLLLGKVTLSSCEVVFVDRKAVDYFYVGKDGCVNDTSVCTTRSATCKSDGWCLCSSSRQTHRNPVIEIDSGKTVYRKNSYGCVNNQYIRFDVGK